MVGAVLLIDRGRIDDPVGAVSVHLVCGIWGTMAVGIFSADHSFVTQAVGVLAYGAVCFPAALGIFFALKQTVDCASARKRKPSVSMWASMGWKRTAASRWSIGRSTHHKPYL